MMDLLLTTAAIGAASWYFLGIKKESGFVYARFPALAHRNAGGSLPNPLEVKRGYMWTPLPRLKSLFGETKKNKVLRRDDQAWQQSRNKSQEQGQHQAAGGIER